MSRQELLEKSVNYLEKMTPERVEEVFHYIEYLYFRYETTIPQVNNFQTLLLDGPTWTDEDNDYFSLQSQKFRNWRVL